MSNEIYIDCKYNTTQVYSGYNFKVESPAISKIIYTNPIYKRVATCSNMEFSNYHLGCK